MAQQTRSEARAYSQFKSPLRWRSSPKRSFHSSKARRSAERKGPAAEGKESIPEGPLTLRQRLKKLSREYGWSAVGVYLTLSVLDFPFCFLLVRTIGTDKIADAEHYVVSNVQKVIPEGLKQWYDEYKSALKKGAKENLGEGVTHDVEMAGWGVAEAEEKNKTEASLATQLALAYAIHKSFIFIRIPLTAAILPKVVKVLRSWGWQIGKRPLKGAKGAAKAVTEAKK
ncbi:peptide alpha-n-acetyltransferase [Coniochaeta sp. 2T2.1]|nr:peptide alpha-n-acetyltransferase [Coniochaeta sp. 2T2.1]